MPVVCALCDERATTRIQANHFCETHSDEGMRLALVGFLGDRYGVTLTAEVLS